MAMNISAVAGTLPIQAVATSGRVSAPGTQTPSTAPTRPTSGATQDVDRIFRLAHDLTQQLNALQDNAEALRVEGKEGVDQQPTEQAIQKMQAQVEGNQETIESFKQHGKELHAQLQRVVNEAGSPKAASQALQAFTERLIADHGPTGHLVNTYA